MKTCKECGRPAIARGLCTTHYNRLMSRRRPSPTRGMTDNERFDHYTSQSPLGCVIWTGATFGAGRYGAFGVNGKTVGAHRYAYERTNGPIPPGAYVCHSCDEPRCVNPAHLFIGAPAENAGDMKIKGRAARGEKQHLSKLTEDDVRFIRSTHLSGVDVAKMLGVSPTAVCSVRKRRTWRHVT